MRVTSTRRSHLPPAPCDSLVIKSGALSTWVQLWTGYSVSIILSFLFESFWSIDRCWVGFRGMCDVTGSLEWNRSRSNWIFFQKWFVTIRGHLNIHSKNGPWNGKMGRGGGVDFQHKPNRIDRIRQDWQGCYTWHCLLIRKGRDPLRFLQQWLRAFIGIFLWVALHGSGEILFRDSLGCLGIHGIRSGISQPSTTQRKPTSFGGSEEGGGHTEILDDSPSKAKGSKRLLKNPSNFKSIGTQLEWTRRKVSKRGRKWPTAAMQVAAKPHRRRFFGNQ